MTISIGIDDSKKCEREGQAVEGVTMGNEDGDHKDLDGKARSPGLAQATTSIDLAMYIVW